mmetsp:Transcript_16196/g.34176  ORF Transcript_16196/g.34176 Transcript_16196/m.34176 type:complete len:251 (+) Transcript_16196:631-1383(+)
MLAPLRDSTCSVSLTSPPPLPSPTVSIRRERRRTSSSSISEAEPLMCPSSPSKRESSRSRPPPVTPTWVERISTTAWSTTSSRTSSVATARTCRRTSVPSVVFVPPASARSALCPAPPRRTLRLTLSLMELISTPPSPAPVSRIYAWTTSRNAWIPARRSCAIPRSPRTRSMRLCLWEDPLVFRRSSPCSLSSSTARSPASPSTLMRLLRMERLCRLPFSLERTSPRSSPSSSCWMSLLFRSVLRPLVES